MARNSKVLKDGKTASNSDRLSRLPDTILGHILSFLPVKDAVATSILSKRWKSVFLHVPEIKLDDFFLDTPRKKSGKSCGYTKSQTSYINSVNQLLMLASGMRIFRLLSRNLAERSVVNLWIRSSLTRNIQELDILVYYGGRIPIEIFTCITLVVLKLGGDAEIEVPKYVSLPKLKVMVWKELKVLGYKSKLEFSVGYTQLEDLHLHRVSFGDVDAIHISISSLQKLAIRAAYGFYYGKNNFVLNTPNLCQMELELTRLNWEVPNSHNSLPQFCKLTFLDLRGEHDFHMLELVLHNTPYLERLLCNVCKKVEYAGHKANSKIMQHLKEVELRNLLGFDHGGFGSNLKMAMYFLEHGVLLKKMVIIDYHGPDSKFYNEVFQSADFKRLLLQASCSPAVEILYRPRC